MQGAMPRDGWGAVGRCGALRQQNVSRETFCLQLKGSMALRGGAGCHEVRCREAEGAAGPECFT